MPGTPGLFLRDAKRAALAKIQHLAEKKNLALARPGSKVLDNDGTLLFYRFPLSERGKVIGFADVTTRHEMGSPLLGFSQTLAWNEDVLRGKALEEVKRFDPSASAAQLVAYNFPRVAWRFKTTTGDLYLDVISLRPVETGGLDERGLPRRSFLAAPRAQSLRGLAEKNQAHFLVECITLCSEAYPATAQADTGDVASKVVLAHFPFAGSQTEVWCVPACIQMILEYYRYRYKQADLANVLGLGTPQWPDPLPCSRSEFKVLKEIHRLSHQALEVEMSVCSDSFWNDFRTEIDAERPVVTFTGGHSVVVTGYDQDPMPDGRPSYSIHIYDPEPIKTKGYSQWVAWQPNSFRLAFFSQLRNVAFAPASGPANGSDTREPGTPNLPAESTH